ncbi:MAG: ATP synthase F1 subunit delta [Hydrogenothermaceae bacterium]|nr:ATP synthase F1 subunit delta [Hydrogenothermaceae bacterium]
MKVDKKFLKKVVKVLISGIEKEESALVDAVTKIDLISKLYRENRVFRNILLNPKLSFEEKEKLLSEVKNSLNLSDSIYQVILFVVKENKANILKEIGKEFRFEVEKFFATLKGEVITAHPIDEELLSKIKAVVESKLGKKVEFTVKEDPSLIAGAVIKAGSYVLDSSIKTFMKKLEQELSRF